MSMFNGMTIRDCYQKHQELWTWLSENPGKSKMEWPGWIEFENFDMEEVEEIAECFGCLVKHVFDVGCSGCIVQWSGGNGCGSTISPYFKWVRMQINDFSYDEVCDKSSELAKRIAGLSLNPYWKDKMNWVINI